MLFLHTLLLVLPSFLPSFVLLFHVIINTIGIPEPTSDCLYTPVYKQLLLVVAAGRENVIM